MKLRKKNFVSPETFSEPQKHARFEEEAEIFRGLFTADEQYQNRGSPGWQLWQ